MMNIDSIEFLEKLKEKLTERHENEFTFLILGKTGVGKSSTINSLMGQNIAPVGDFEPTTMTVEKYTTEMSGINCNIIDTPGLCDDLPEHGNDEKYLEMVRSSVKKVDSLWFVTKLKDKIGFADKRVIQLISNVFGQDIWKQAIIILTYSWDVSDEEKFKEGYKIRTRLIKEEVKKYTNDEIASGIPSVAVDNTNTLTPDGKNWLGELYTEVFLRMSENGAIPFLMATVNRINPVEPSKSETVKYIYLDKNQEEKVKKKSKNLLEQVAKFAGVIIKGFFGF
ncbi:50S ribosome-binding GTPase [Candidatus Synechococcus calcipolaris G9]|uniref:50S ribosome-binding GTPase n=1 Tax=Candidatus Synechococcus calcipolaris G9 TaxID=1497997 RepID=A0ABT6F0U1_9SYNE|nr:GTPase [Candidatus Synechococcus calcipolaris]MDG2991473.1 50S ribosome-binding GTPase [Candidatus Synechococcus calcipolaris G9]